MAIFGAAEEKKPRKAERRPARVEPKTFFANERTYIQWLGTALSLLTIASFNLLFSNGQGDGTLAVGVVMIVVSFIIIVYAFFSYMRRLKLLQIRANNGYLDHFMPVIVSVSVCVSVVVLLYYFGVEVAKQRRGEDPSTYSGTVLFDNPTGGCTRHATNGVKSLSYSPSGIVHDNERRVFLIPSLDKITALTSPSSSPQNSTVQTLLTIPGAQQLGGLTYATDNRIFTVSNGANSGEQPILYELAWGQESTNSTTTNSGSSTTVQVEKMRVVNAWTLQTTTTSTASSKIITGHVAPGITYAPSNDFDGLPPSLLVAGDAFDGKTNAMNRGQVFVFEVPAPSLTTPSMEWNGNSSVFIGAPPTTEEGEPVNATEDEEDNGDDKKPEKLDKAGALNPNLINGGLIDSKIGDVFFFENILYILNDHARVIRAWSREGGTLLATTVLPRVGEGFDLNWSGLAIERPITGSGSGSGSNLRGGPGAPLLVHLSLDSPPQVWTFNATQGAVNGSIVFPACASAF